MQLNGYGVGTRTAIGTVVRMPDPLPIPSEAPFTGKADEEQQRVRDAATRVRDALTERAATAAGSMREVLEAQAMMAVDPSVLQLVDQAIAAGRSGERGVYEAFTQYAEVLRGMGGYMAERATDLHDVSQRIRADLAGVPVPEVPHRDELFVLVAIDLAPADTASLDLDRVLAFVTRDGSPKAHTGIIAAERGLPAVVACKGADEIAEGDTVIVDAAAGTVVVAPDDEQLAAARERLREQEQLDAEPAAPGELADGTAVQILANVGKPGDAERAAAAGAEGVGLFRTEFMFLDRDQAPSFDDQLADYTEMMRPFAGRKVVARVLDAGADKPLPFLNDADEPNPALGMRGIRILREREPLLRDQLRALHEAAEATGVELWVMAPMVADAGESEYFTALAREIGIDVAGSMVEVPSAALLADQILESSDFVSLGTNDLTQYALAADRVLGTVANFQDPWHPAVLRLIQAAGEAGLAAQKNVGVCGEAAADPQLAVVLVGLGVRSLSMAPPAMAAVRAALREVTLEDARAIAARALRARSAQQARELAFPA